jgi:2-polyprenyl-3-methyl-5-hydroxy-6-metoxy-1,4-benzoquinol methylase
MLSFAEIEKISTGVDLHLNHLKEFTDGLWAVKQSIDELKHSRESKFLWELQLLRQEFADLKSYLKRYGLPEVSEYEKELNKLREFLPDWPQAVDVNFTSDSPEKNEQQSEIILNCVVGECLKGKKFLDYGCGEGHIVQNAIKKETKYALGYDIDLKDISANFTNDFNEVRKHAPFDIILAYDVLDHIQDISPVEALQQMQSVLSKNGRIFLYNHPWSSRHGGHLYKKFNKAFIHLVFDEIELTRAIGCQCDFNLKVINPLETYRQWIQEAGLEIKSEIPIKSPIEPVLLQHPYIRKRLIQIWTDEKEARANLEIDFVEYIIDNKNFMIL